jgi:hypothetical protein
MKELLASQQGFAAWSYCTRIVTKIHEYFSVLRSINMSIALLSLYSVILSVLDLKKCEYLKDCSLEFEHAYITTYLAGLEHMFMLYASHKARYVVIYAC